MKQNPQGKQWRRLDNTGKLFPLIANENLSNVFRVCVVLKEPVQPERLKEALDLVLPRFKGFKVKLKRGFFWYYFEGNSRPTYVEEEQDWPCRYIAPKSCHLYPFRVSFYQNRINFEVFHAVSDGKGAVEFLKELAFVYLQLCQGKDPVFQSENEEEKIPEDSYLKNYRKTFRQRYDGCPAYQLKGAYLSNRAEAVVQGTFQVEELKKICRREQVSVTKYLTACLIWAIYQVSRESNPKNLPIGVNVPVNLRTFFGSDTTANFFAVTTISWKDAKNLKVGGGSDTDTFHEILQEVSRQMDEKIEKEKLEQIISYNVSNEKKWYVRITPLFLKWLALGIIFRRSSRGHTVTLSNIGVVSVPKEYEDAIEGFQMMIGVSRRQPVKCGICAYGNRITVSFTSVFQDSRLQEYFFERLKKEGLLVETESNGAVLPQMDRHHFPAPPFRKGREKRAAGFGKWVLAVMFLVQAVMILADIFLKGGGWSLQYGIPTSILAADVVLILFMVVHKNNWQSYFMYQLAMTFFSLFPLLFWLIGWIKEPFMAAVSAVLTLGILLITISAGKKRFRRELERRFHV